jgi:hypothetical protein
VKLNELVEKYIAVRDRKAKIKAEYDGKVAELDAVLDKIEAVLLKTFQETGMDSVKTGAGTAYRSTRAQASIADWDTFLTHVKDNGAFELLERRCSKTAVEQYKAANDDIPPGVNWREEQVVNIRRSS